MGILVHRARRSGAAACARRLLAPILLIVATACTAGEVAEPARSPSAGPWRGGTLRVVTWLPGVTELDPATSYWWGTHHELYRCCLLRTLFSYNGLALADGGAEPLPDLAAGPPDVSSDGLTWTFEIRPNLHYAPPYEGTEIVAADIVRALERIPPPGDGVWEYGFYYSVIDGYDEFRAGEAAGIAGLETPDPHTLIVHLDRPTGDLPYRLAMHATAPVPAGAADGHLGEYFRFLVSSGPYMIEGSEDLDPSLPPTEQRPVSGFTPQAEIDAGGEPRVGLTLARNPSWDPATDPLRGAYADRIELVLRPIPQLGTAASDRAIARRLDRGAVDLTLVGSLGQLDRYRSDPALADRLAVSPQDDLNYLPMNLAVPPFDDIEVRKAVNLAIDKSVLADRFIELTSPDTLFVPLAHLLPDATEGGLLGPGWRARWAAGVGPEGDLAAARRAMARSRYDADGDGRCDAAPCRSVEVLVDETASVPGHRYGWFWRQVRDDLAPLGIVIEARIEDCEDALDVAGHPSERVPLFIGVCVGWLSDFPSGSGVFQPLLHGGSINDRNNQNYSLLGASGDQLRRWGYDVRSAPSLDVRIDACLQQIGRAQIGCWADLDRFAMEEVVPWVPLYTTSSLFVLSDRVASWSYSVFGRSPALDRIALVPGSG